MTKCSKDPLRLSPHGFEPHVHSGQIPVCSPKIGGFLGGGGVPGLLNHNRLITNSRFPKLTYGHSINIYFPFVIKLFKILGLLQIKYACLFKCSQKKVRGYSNHPTDFISHTDRKSKLSET